MTETKRTEVEEQAQGVELGIGEKLKAQRKAQGISLVEVMEHTKIAKKYLEALEEERFDFLPSPAYIKGFLRAYAKYLELDDEKMIRQYKARFHTTEREEENESAEVQEKQNNQSIWIPLLSMIILAGLGAGVFLLWPSEEPQDQEVVQEAVVPNAVNESAQEAIPAVPGANDMLTLKIRAKERTWITLMIDGKQEPDITLAANEERQWRAKDRFVLWTGNAGGIEVYFNGVLQPALGKTGEVRKEIIFERKTPVVNTESTPDQP